MAIIFMDGFDTYNGITSVGANTGIDSYWAMPAGTTSLSISAGRFGGQSVTSTIFVSPYFANYFTPTSQFVCGHSFYQATLSLAVATINPYISFWSDATAMMGLKVNVDGSMSVCRLTGFTAGTILGTTAINVIRAATWHSIEFACSISDTTGTVNLVVDGVNVLSLTNQDTRNGTPTTINQVRLGGTNGGNSTPNRTDDLYITDSLTLLGPQKIETLYASADTAQKQLTPSTGSNNYGTVDETLMNNTDYVYSNTVGNYDLYDFGNLSSTPNTISAVQVGVLAQKDNVGTRAIAPVLKSGSTTVDGANTYLAGAFAVTEQLYNTDPNTGGAWSAGSVNALQAGVKVTI